MTYNQNRGTAAQPNNQDQQTFQNMQPDDYLERTNVSNQLKESVSLLLENRPENPILFLADHFRNLHSSTS